MLLQQPHLGRTSVRIKVKGSSKRGGLEIPESKVIRLILSGPQQLRTQDSSWAPSQLLLQPAGFR